MGKKWLFHATDFQTLMYPCFTICRVLGAFPYKINNSIFAVSKLYYVISVAIISTLCVVELVNLYEFNVFTKIKIEIVTSSLENNCFIILTNSMIIVTFIFSSPRMRLLQTIMKISVKISPQSYQELSRLIHTKDIFGFLYLTSIIFTYIYVQKLQMLRIIFAAHKILFVFQIDMLYVNCVCILKACFKEIDINLLCIKKLIVNNKLHVPKTIYYKQKNPFLIIKLKTMKEQHLIISKTVKMLNVIFSLHLLLTITYTFITIIFGLHFHLLRWHDGLVINKDGNFILFTYIVYQIIKMTLFVWICETGKNQAQNIGTTIHDVLNNTKDEQIKDELQFFSLQILHLDNTFSAKGFNVNAAFFAKMIGTITTYMFILLQFFIISHSCDGKSKINITQIT
ncbi:putative gustatory receptor 28b isoform X2 [Monomorium pharaonis]|uniref:putative gustatory receptor 28b isoform X2 n=1 Tax=Monomorium pharaonis TaxID=307658 RepID=UPI00174617B2|nr:putative gustatory receptor 28b isoform X2 [Monomorium pharaonis]